MELAELTEIVGTLSQALLSLQTEVGLLRRDMGDAETPPDLSHPPAELPNGRYPLMFRMHQIGVAVDSLSDAMLHASRPSQPTTTPAVDEDRVRAIVREEIRAAETGIRAIVREEISTSAPGNVVTPDAATRELVVSTLREFGIWSDESGRLGLFGPPVRDPRDNTPLMNYPLTINGEHGVSIALVGNASLTDPQRRPDNAAPEDKRDPQRKHVATISLGHDGGLRLGMNGLYAAGKEVLLLDEFRNLVNIGTDSRGVWSGQDRDPMPDPAYPGFFKSKQGFQEFGLPGQDYMIFPRGTEWSRGDFVIGITRPGAKFRVLESVGGPNAFDTDATARP